MQGGTQYGPRKSLTKTQLQSAVALELLDLLEGVTADGKIDSREAELLQAWLDDHDVAGLPSIEYLRGILMHVLEDGILTAAESTEVHKAIEAVLPIEARRGAKDRRKASEAALRAAQQQAKDAAHAEAAKNLPITTFDFILAGVSHNSRYLTIRGYAHPGDKVYLVREPDNPHDGNAVKVLLTDGQHIGYVPRDTASWLRHSLDSGTKQIATIKKILDGRRYETPVIAVALYSEKCTLADAEATTPIGFNYTAYLPGSQSAPKTEQDSSPYGCIIAGGFLFAIMAISQVAC